MTRMLSSLTARKSPGYLSGLFSLALLLFSSVGVYANDTSANEQTQDKKPKPTLKYAMTIEQTVTEAGKEIVVSEVWGWDEDFIARRDRARAEKLTSAIRDARELSSQLILLDAATRKLSTDKNPDNKKLRSSFLKTKQAYDESVIDLAKIYVKTEENPNADQSVVSYINAELSQGDDYFTERFLLELDKLKNHVSDEDYQLKKAEIDDRYAQKYMPAAAFLTPDDAAWMLAQLSSRVETLRKLVDTLKENEPALRGWFLGVPGLATPFLVYLLFRKKETEESDLRRKREWREAAEFELLELKKRQLENANIKAELEIEKEKIELERLKKTGIIVAPTDEQIKKYSASVFPAYPVESGDGRNNYFGN